MQGPRCPTCRGTLATPPDRAVFPFCSARCRTIDLGAWIDERYRVAGAAHADEDVPAELDAPADAERH